VAARDGASSQIGFSTYPEAPLEGLASHWLGVSVTAPETIVTITHDRDDLHSLKAHAPYFQVARIRLMEDCTHGAPMRARLSAVVLGAANRI
jgi:hypothetical protein